MNKNRTMQQSTVIEDLEYVKPFYAATPYPSNEIMTSEICNTSYLKYQFIRLLDVLL